MTDAPPKLKNTYVELGKDPHQNGTSLAEAAEQMLLDLGKYMERTAETEICEGCFWSMIATQAVIQAAVHHRGGVPGTLLTVAKAVQEMMDGGPQSKPTHH